MAINAPKQTGYKTCNKCQRTLQITQFTPYAANRDGRKHTCRACVNERIKELQRQDPSRLVKQREKSLAWIRANKDAYLASKKKSVAKNRHKIRVYRRRANLRAFGLTTEMYDAMLQAQGGHCACCPQRPGVENNGKHFPVDHCHATGRVRGILCVNCNRVIGWAGDDPARLRRLADYLSLSVSGSSS